jgi:hypothetical protein
LVLLAGFSPCWVLQEIVWMLGLIIERNALTLCVIERFVSLAVGYMSVLSACPSMELSFFSNNFFG